MKYLLYSIALPKRHAFMHKIYRRMHRAYAWIIGIPDRIYITMNGPKVAAWLLFTAGGVIGVLFGLLTLLIP